MSYEKTKLILETQINQEENLLSKAHSNLEEKLQKLEEFKKEYAIFFNSTLNSAINDFFTQYNKDAKFKSEGLTTDYFRNELQIEPYFAVGLLVETNKHTLRFYIVPCFESLKVYIICEIIGANYHNENKIRINEFDEVIIDSFISKGLERLNYLLLEESI